MGYVDKQGNVWSSREVYNHYMAQKKEHGSTLPPDSRKEVRREARTPKGKKPMGFIDQLRHMARPTKRRAPAKPRRSSQRIVYVERPASRVKYVTRRAKPKKRKPNNDFWGGMDPFSW
jgi:hypothetical protein